ncbi:aminotransferase class III-fold pyridoxal phosphate-dependent enzyme [Clostridiaceae bacterium M8S5]|nr:aminotransferase class III-fold pyridoxal phosphate-dependent enzyme [Clostridiaceae bacterium M8S5]
MGFEKSVLEIKNKEQNALICGWTKVNDEKDAVYWPEFVDSDRHFLITKNGTQYLDAKSTLLCTSFGHKNKEILVPIAKQLEQLAFSQSSDYHSNKLAVLLCDKLIDITENNFSKVYLSTTGTSGVELAFLFTFLYHRSKKDFKRKIIGSFKDAYHGCSLGVYKYTASEEYQEMYNTSTDYRIKLDLPNCSVCKSYNEEENCELECFESLKKNLKSVGLENIAAIIIEPITMKVVLPPKIYYKKIRQLTKKNGILLIFDEVVTGFGRIGSEFAFMYYDIKPDILILSKSLSNGILPIAATLFRKEIYDEIAKSKLYLEYGSTQDANLTCCMSAIATINYFEKNRFSINSSRMGNRLLIDLRQKLRCLNIVSDVRGLGLFLGIELHLDLEYDYFKKMFLLKKCFIRNQILVHIEMPMIIITPPLNINEEVIDEISNRLVEALEEFEKELKNF